MKDTASAAGGGAGMGLAAAAFYKIMRGENDVLDPKVVLPCVAVGAVVGGTVGYWDETNIVGERGWDYAFLQDYKRNSAHEARGLSLAIEDNDAARMGWNEQKLSNAAAGLNFQIGGSSRPRLVELSAVYYYQKWATQRAKAIQEFREKNIPKSAREVEENR